MHSKSSARGPSGLFLVVTVLSLSTAVSLRAAAAQGPVNLAETGKPSRLRIAGADALRAEKDKLQGTWTLEAVRFGHSDAKDLKEDQWGQEWKNLRLTFSGDGVVLQSPSNPKAKAEPYKLDPSKSPKELDIGRGSSLEEYIYHLQGDKLMLAFSPGELVAGGTFTERQWQTRRPHDFKETPENAPPIIWILKRVKH